MGPEAFERPTDRVSESSVPLVNSSIQRCSASLVHEGSVPWTDIPNAELRSHNSQLSGCGGLYMYEPHDSRVSTCDIQSRVPVELQVHREVRKVSRPIGGCSKRQRVARIEDNLRSAGGDDCKDMTTKCIIPEKIQMVKPRNGLSGKRSEKKNFKVPMKSKLDSVSRNVGSDSFPAVSPANRFLGLYGLKPDVHDVTTLVEELSLNELLDGTCKAPTLRKDKKKQEVDTNENLLVTVRKACSLIRLRKPVSSQGFSEIDSCSNKLLPSCSLVENDFNADKGDSCTPDLSLCDEGNGPCTKSNKPTSLLDFQLCKPEEFLERLALPPPKDLESLLLDAAKPSASSRSTSDLRSCRQISRRPSLPPFSWSHAYTGHGRTTSESVKFQPSKSTCPGRWFKIAKDASHSETRLHCLTDVESLSCDKSIVPSGSRLTGVEQRSISTTDNFCFSQWISSSSGTYAQAFQFLMESGLEVNDQGSGGLSPRVLAAAQILHQMANDPPRRNIDGITRWPNKPSQKAMKTRKPKSTEKLEKICSAPSAKPVRSNVDVFPSSKKPKASTLVENRKDLTRTTTLRKRLVSWSVPKPSKLKDSTAEARHNANVVKRNGMMYPPASVLDLANGSQQHTRRERLN